MLTQFVIPGISFGLSAVSIPGPLQAYLLNVTLTYGWRRGLLVVLAPLIVDTPVIIVTVFLLGQLPDWAIQGIRLAGGLLLLWIAWGAYQQFRSGAQFGPSKGQHEDANAPPETVRSGQIMRMAIMMNALSPGPYLFWATVNGPLLIAALDQSLFHALVFMVSFYGTFLGGMTILVFIFDRLGRINERVTRGIIGFTVILLLGFGTRLIAEALGVLQWHLLLMGLAVMVGALLSVWQGRKTPISSDIND